MSEITEAPKATAIDTDAVAKDYIQRKGIEAGLTSAQACAIQEEIVQEWLSTLECAGEPTKAERVELFKAMLPLVNASQYRQHLESLNVLAKREGRARLTPEQLAAAAME